MKASGKLMVLCLLWPALSADSTASDRTRFGTTAFLSFRDPTGEFHFARPAARDRAIMLDLMKEAGLTDLREAVLQWGEIQPAKNAHYDFSLIDDLILQAGRRHIEILGIFTAVPQWASVGEGGKYPRNMSPQDPRTFAPLRDYEKDFRRFVYTAVRRYGSSPDALPGMKVPVRYWEFYNEVDGGWWQDPDVYSFWLKAFSEEVKRADPQARVVLGGLASAGITVADAPHKHDPSYLERLLSSPQLKGPGFPYFDVVNIHNYPMVYGDRVVSGAVRQEFVSRNGLEPRGVLAGYEPLLFSLDVMKAYLSRVMDAYELDLPIWLTEIGDNSQYTGPTEQAARLIKYMVHAASLGFERVYQFSFYDLGKNPGEGEWGLVKLVEPGGTPPRKPAFHAVESFLREYRRVRGVRFLGPGIYQLDDPEGESGFCLWKEVGARSILPSIIRGRLRLVDLEGKVRHLDASQLELSRSPVLVFPE